LCDELEKSSSTVLYHLNKLIDADIVEKFKEKNENKYQLKNEKETDKLLIKHKEGLLDDLVVAFYDLLIVSEKNMWIRPVVKFLRDNEDFLWEIFPHPYWG
jgi:DNA-binding transcriptional ArsR family regulator